MTASRGELLQVYHDSLALGKQFDEVFAVSDSTSLSRVLHQELVDAVGLQEGQLAGFLNFMQAQILGHEFGQLEDRGLEVLLVSEIPAVILGTAGRQLREAAVWKVLRKTMLDSCFQLAKRFLALLVDTLLVVQLEQSESLAGSQLEAYRSEGELFECGIPPAQSIGLRRLQKLPGLLLVFHIKFGSLLLAEVDDQYLLVILAVLFHTD